MAEKALLERKARQGEIVGWFYRNGKRIPLRKTGAGSSMLNAYHGKANKAPIDRKRTWSENRQKEERQELMKDRGVTSWKDVPDYLKTSTGTQTPGSVERDYGTKSRSQERISEQNRKRARNKLKPVKIKNK